jgi:hypothetical protein
MQDEAAVGLDGAAVQDQLRGLRFVADLERELIEDLGQRHVRGPIDNDPERTVVVVLADVSDGLREVRVAHSGHRDEKLALQ